MTLIKKYVLVCIKCKTPLSPESEDLLCLKCGGGIFDLAYIEVDENR